MIDGREAYIIESVEKLNNRTGDTKILTIDSENYFIWKVIITVAVLFFMMWGCVALM